MAGNASPQAATPTRGGFGPGRPLDIEYGMAAVTDGSPRGRLLTRVTRGAAAWGRRGQIGPASWGDLPHS